MLTTRKVFAAILLVSGLALAGCGKSAPGAPNFDPATGKHTPVDWASNHGTTYVQYQKQCQNCHGKDFLGGTSQVSCGECHLLPHAVPFIHFSSHTKVLALQNNTNLCTPCHGSAFQGGKVAPACGKCHTNLPIGGDLSSSVPKPGECTSCHDKVTGPDGNIFPNRSGAHQRHFSRVNANLSCQDCHLGGGSDTANHGSILTVKFPATLNVPGTAATYNTITKQCSNVACHGGKSTPGWGVGHFNTASACNSCHADGKGNPLAPYNSYSSGHHGIHATLGCTVCHDMTYGAPGHFSNMTTHKLELSPVLTLKAGFGYNSGSQSCAAGLGCHDKAGHLWRQ